MRDFLGEIQPLLLMIVRSLIDEPTVATVQVNRDVAPVTLMIRVAPNDVGKIIGSGGRTARSIRIVLGASAQTYRHPMVAVDIGPNA
jgi:predicted RNA-binding protein YlqC (UPF0109 family)